MAATSTKLRNDARRSGGYHGTDTTTTSVLSAGTEALVRRILCPQTTGNLLDVQTPLEQLLPPLTSSHEVDAHVYAILAIVMRDFVYSWYGKITPDQSFVEETIRIVAHSTRELEQRLRRIDLELLILHEIPNILEKHIIAYKTAKAHQFTLNSPDPEFLYHTLFPHQALSPAPEHGLSTVEQIKNEAAYRQLLIQGTLAVLLPTEDLRNPCLRTLVTDILADMILGNSIGGKASAGWLMWDGIAKALDPNINTIPQVIKNPKSKHEAKTRLEKFGLLSTSNAAKSALELQQRSAARVVSDTFWRIVQYCFFSVMALRFILVGLWTASTRSASSRQPHKYAENRVEKPSPIGVHREALSYSTISQRPFLTYTIFGLSSRFLELSERMPWTIGYLSLIQHHLVDGVLQVGATGAIFDKFLRNTFKQQVLRPELVPQILQIVRSGVFPNDALGPARPIPSLEEQRLIKRRAAIAILKQIPSLLASHYLASDDTQAHVDIPSMPESETSGHRDHETKHLAGAVSPAPSPEVTDSSSSDVQIPDPNVQREAQLADVESILDVFGNQYMNKHMLYSIVELVIVRLIPELETRSVKDLLNDRIGTG